jgi:hypothetical protein
LAKKLQNPIFIKNLGLMYDALEELSDLSLALQKADITLPTAHRHISRQIEVFIGRKEHGAQFYNEACHSIEGGKFKGVVINTVPAKEREINKNQFYQALADSISARLLPESQRALCAAVAVIDPGRWPVDMSKEYGENEIRYLCNKFSLPFSDIKTEYREFKDKKGVASALRALMNRVNTIPVSTAECERGFSRMNIVCSSLRSRLTVQHMSSLMFICMTGPPLKQWEPSPYVKSWLALNRRDATCTQCLAKNNSDDDINISSILRQSIWQKL